MKTDFYEADAFTGSKGEHWASIDSDYRWEKGDEVWLEAKGKRAKLRPLRGVNDPGGFRATAERGAPGRGMRRSCG